MMSLGGSNNLISSSNSSSGAKFPFTPTQWQELEHQALIYKYMISGLPIPPDLLFSLRKSLDSPLSSSLLQLQPPHQHHIGWNCFQLGYGRKIDPEPGRCRRTDGKKWRCSKEAYPDSKYCERHMHRGRNRSRKPVEIVTNTSPSKPIISQNSPSSLFSQSNTPTSFSSMTFVDTPPSYPFLHPHSSSSRSHGFGFSSSNERDRDYGYTYGTKEEIDEHPFFSESSGSVRDYSDSPTLSHLKQRTSDLGYPFLHLNDSSKAQQKQDQYFHIMDGDFHREMPMKPERDDVKPHQVMHHFFDELPKDRDSWEDESSSYMGASTTQLSISTPNSSYDFFMAHDDK